MAQEKVVSNILMSGPGTALSKIPTSVTNVSPREATSKVPGVVTNVSKLNAFSKISKPNISSQFCSVGPCSA